MISSSSFLALTTKISKAPKQIQYSIFHYFLLSRSISNQTQNPSFSTTHISVPTRLNHKDWLAPNEVLRVFSTIRDPNSVVSALDCYSKRKDYKPNEALYTLILNKLAEARLYDAIDGVVCRIRAERNCRLSDEFFRNVIRVYGVLAGRINKAIETLFDMPRYDCWPTVKTFNLVLNLLVSARLFDVVHEVYVGAPKLGIEIDACCLNILVKGLCECGKLDDALKVLDEFPQQKLKPNALTFSTLMHGFCVYGKVEKAFGLFERMEKEGVDPDTITFNILISGLRKQGRVDEGMLLLERMKLKGCDPNAGSYQEVLYGLLDTERFSEAKEFMRKVISKGVSPSFKSYKALIHGLCKGNQLEDVDWILKQMGRQGFVPKMGMWRQILRCQFAGKSSHSCDSFEDIMAN
ncbi:Pentatricopeptide repeat [Trema orientale]|uniref:Pentatricopeptide repeat n=1 Tax=Trema orientale TaxID=63057 RepID=A0A2P5ECU0_TREOI|nr:Pentatricopeptide repeat [Trema orientale]